LIAVFLAEDDYINFDSVTIEQENNTAFVYRSFFFIDCASTFVIIKPNQQSNLIASNDGSVIGVKDLYIAHPDLPLEAVRKYGL
jgi:hypothetical protein